MIDADHELQRHKLRDKGCSETADKPAEATACRRPSQRIGDKRDDRQHQERPAGVLLDEDRHGHEGAGDQPPPGCRVVIRREDHGDRCEDHDARVGVVERCRDDRVDTQWHERDRERRGE